LSYNGSGVFVINSTGQPVVTGTVISSSVFNSLTSDLATGLSTAITKDGQTTITNNIPFGNNKITGLAVATTSGDALSYGQAATVAALTATSISDSGNLTFTGTGNRIIGDFTNATIANRVAFQTSSANTATTVLALPSGSGTTASWDAYNNSDPTNSGYLGLTGLSSEVRIASSIRGTGTYLPMTFYTNGSERVRIDTSGNVGIGTSSPSSPLNVVSASSGLAIAINGRSSDNLGAMYFYANNGSTQYATITTSATEFRLSSVPAAAVQTFYTNGAERMRIDSSGNLTCAGVYSATVGATNRDVYVDNTGLIGYVSSIRASKTEIQNLADVSWLNQLNPVSFKYRKKDEDGNYTDETDGDIQYGMIAEDVEQVRPDLCFYDEVDGEQELRGIQYSKLVPVMLKAIQELNAKVAALEAKLN